jgi:hypothetical protein
MIPHNRRSRSNHTRLVICALHPDLFKNIIAKQEYDCYAGKYSGAGVNEYVNAATV